MASFFSVLLFSFFVSSIITFFVIVLLKILKLKQVEREEGPKSHKAKTGTPTMGGIGFIITATVISMKLVDQKYFPAIYLFLGFALIGFLDDFIKVFKVRNLGLGFWQKIILQTIAASVFAFFYSSGILSFCFFVFLIVGAANASNITDGLDGLLSGTAILAFGSFLFIGLHLMKMGCAALCVIFIGAILGFLIYNFPKSKIFMGDTGSLSIGAVLAGLAIIMQREWLLAVVCGLYAIEALSVIIQVGSYKLFKKRIFKMAPLHHHFELMGMSELNIVLMFWAIQLILSIIGVLIG